MSTITDAEVSNAVVVALTNTDTGAPIVSSQKFEDHYGPDTASELLPRVVALLHEAMSIEVDWRGKSLDAGRIEVIAKMHTGHPYLSETALGLIGGYFSFRWR